MPGAWCQVPRRPGAPAAWLPVETSGETQGKTPSSHLAINIFIFIRMVFALTIKMMLMKRMMMFIIHNEGDDMRKI